MLKRKQYYFEMVNINHYALGRNQGYIGVKQTGLRYIYIFFIMYLNIKFGITENFNLSA